MKKILIIIPVVIILVLVILNFSLNSIIKGGVETFGPKVTGVDVRLNKAAVSPFTGKGELTGIFIGNPKGFHTDSAFKLGEVRVALNVKSVFSDRIVIDDIFIDAPDITYETSGPTDNVRTILDNIKKGSGESGKQGEGPSSGDAGGPQKKIIIKKLLIRNGKINVSSTLLQGEKISLDLPAIEMKGIGEEKGGASLSDAMEMIFAVLNKNILNTVAGQVKEIGKNLEKTVEGAVEKQVGKSVTGTLKGLLGK